MRAAISAAAAVAAADVPMAEIFALNPSNEPRRAEIESMFFLFEVVLLLLLLLLLLLPPPPTTTTTPSMTTSFSE